VSPPEFSDKHTESNILDNSQVIFTNQEILQLNIADIAVGGGIHYSSQQQPLT